MNINLAQQLAEQLNGREYLNETTPQIVLTAKQNGLVIVFAYSDDNCEFRGAIDEEIPCWCGAKIFFNADGSNFTNSDGEAFLTSHKDKESPEQNMIEAVWCTTEKVTHESGEYYAWTYKTEIPHATFDIMEDGKPFCQGIVFSITALK